jgi:hypothetical protein
MSAFQDSYTQLGHRHTCLLTEGGLCSGEIYKHGPPGGGRLVLRRRANPRCSGATQSDKITTLSKSTFNHTPLHLTPKLLVDNIRSTALHS